MSETLTLEQKLLELRKALPKIQKERHSDAVSYKFAKIDDVWRAITPKMNELGVNFCVSREENVDCTPMTTATKNGERLMFIYHADLTVLWTNTENPEDVESAIVHCVGWNDDPAKAKGCAHTYALKYYLFEKFSVDMSDSDPDGQDNSASSYNSGSGYKSPKQPVKQQTGGGYMYEWGKHKGRTVAEVEAEHPDYNDWALNAEKSPQELRNAIMACRAKPIVGWDDSYPPPPPEYV